MSLDEALALELNFVTDSYRLHRRYNRMQLWRVQLWMVGIDSEGEESRYEVDLIPSEPVMATDMVALTAQHYTEMAEEYVEVVDAGVRLFRLDNSGYRRLQALRATEQVQEVPA